MRPIWSVESEDYDKLLTIKENNETGSLLLILSENYKFEL